ncbi:MAG: hypothetical protein HOP11_12320 [Saprospiraceae bacterium]|nr:hypothetical protein [Saprospiraceae bacterium]
MTYQSCVHQSLRTEPHQVNVIITDSSRYKSLIIKYGYCNEYYIDSIKIFHVSLESLRGGRQKLFGLITITEHDPNDFRRILIVDSTRFICEYSINEILKMDTFSVGGKLVYKLK